MRRGALPAARRRVWIPDDFEILPTRRGMRDHEEWMATLLTLLKPALWLIFAVGLARFGLTLLGAPRWAVYSASLTLMELAGGLYLAVRVGRRRDLGYWHLWAGTLLLFGEAQSLYIAGLVYTLVANRPTLYHETARLVAFLGYEPTIPEHIGMHVTNWMIIAPTLFTWVVAAPIVYCTRRFTKS